MVQRLLRDNPSAAAVRNGKNNVDNVEVVYIENPGAGTYTVHVDHDGNLSGGSQAYSLIISGIDEYVTTPECSEQLLTPEDGGTEVMLNQYISWKPANFATSYDVYFGTDGGGTSTPVSVFNGENFITNGFSYLMHENTTYYLKVVPRNNKGQAVGCDNIWSFTTMSAITSFPYIEDVENVTTPDIPANWTTYNTNDVEWFSTSITANSGNNSLGCYFEGSLELLDMNNWLVSPPFRVQDGKEYLVSFDMMTFIPSQPEQMSLYWGYAPYTDSLTHLMWERTDLSIAAFEHFNTLYIPNMDTIVYFGWHYHSTPGYGSFIDDMMVEDWGAVGVNENKTNNDPHIYTHGKQVRIYTDESWRGAEIRIVNLLGQTVSSDKMDNSLSKTIYLDNNSPGIYLVTISNGVKPYTVKVVLK